MRIAYVSHDEFPATATNTQQTFWTVVEAARTGVNLTLVVPPVGGAEADARASLARYYGVPLHGVPGTLTVERYGKKTTPAWLTHWRFDRAVAKHLSRGGYDLVWTRDPLALVSSLRAGLPTMFETYRPDFATSGRFAAWRYACLRHERLRGMILHSRLAAKAYHDAGVPPERCLVAYNAFAPSLFAAPQTRTEARRRLDLDDKSPLVVYAGHTGRRKGLDHVIRLAARVPSARFLVVGVASNASEHRRLETLISRAGAQNVVLNPWVPLSDVPTYLYAADCLLIPPTGVPLQRFRRTVLPMKVFMYLAAGRPILAPRLPDVEEVLTDGQTARLVAPDNPAEAASALAHLLADRALQDQLSRNALALSAEYTWSARARRIMDFVATVVRGS
jgi:glycosyltransferase involved in cell wall biosynthesis